MVCDHRKRVGFAESSSKTHDIDFQMPLQNRMSMVVNKDTSADIEFHTANLAKLEEMVSTDSWSTDLVPHAVMA
jgi:hypothetical protein